MHRDTRQTRECPWRLQAVRVAFGNLSLTGSAPDWDNHRVIAVAPMRQPHRYVLASRSLLMTPSRNLAVFGLLLARALPATTASAQSEAATVTPLEIGRTSCRERVGQYV